MLCSFSMTAIMAMWENESLRISVRKYRRFHWTRARSPHSGESRNLPFIGDFQLNIFRKRNNFFFEVKFICRYGVRLRDCIKIPPFFYHYLKSLLPHGVQEGLLDAASHHAATHKECVESPKRSIDSNYAGTYDAVVSQAVG